MIAPRTLTWFLGMMALAALGLVMSLTGAARPFQSSAQWVAAPLESAISRAINPVADFFANIGSYGNMRQENVELRQENERLRAALAQVQESENQAANLAELLNLSNQFQRDQLTFATIIARDPNPSRDVLAIGRGSDDGVQVGMAVLSKGGALVGTVEVAYARVSWVRLLTDRRSAVNAVVQETRAQALAAGAGETLLRMEFLSQGADLKPGDSVVSSGLGGSYPPGLLLGRVASVEGGPHEVFKKAQVEPAARLDDLEAVAVLTGFRPAPVEGIGR